MTQLIKELGEQFASRAEQTDRTFTLHVPDVSVSILGNEMQLKQALINLLENAFKFTPANGTISLNLEHAVNEVTLTISDSGIGIPPEDLSQLFERFHRGRNVADYAGNGLGLAIVKAIVNLHDGNVVIQSKAQHGTVVSVTFPVVTR